MTALCTHMRRWPYTSSGTVSPPYRNHATMSCVMDSTQYSTTPGIPQTHRNGSRRALLNENIGKSCCHGLFSADLSPTFAAQESSQIL